MSMSKKEARAAKKAEKPKREKKVVEKKIVEKKTVEKKAVKDNVKEVVETVEDGMFPSTVDTGGSVC
jgi:hypothetical protein